MEWYTTTDQSNPTFLKSEITMKKWKVFVHDNRRGIAFEIVTT